MKIKIEPPMRTITVEMDKEKFIIDSATHTEFEARLLIALRDLNFDGGFHISNDVEYCGLTEYIKPQYKITRYVILTRDWQMPEEDIVKAITSAFQV
ncbi:MAG: hypothetical protein HF312_15710 [Ignavibacteria bacterium]|jgi:hypothetical protein|nr:hypothetical protein [Ignavibacteria bacterium]